MDIIKGFAHLNGFTIETYTLYRVSKKKHAFGEIHLQPCLVTHSLLISHEKTVASEEEVGGGGGGGTTSGAEEVDRCARETVFAGWSVCVCVRLLCALGR